jgi:hypothetical protein
MYIFYTLLERYNSVICSSSLGSKVLYIGLVKVKLHIVPSPLVLLSSILHNHLGIDSPALCFEGLCLLGNCAKRDRSISCLSVRMGLESPRHSEGREGSFYRGTRG